MGVDRELVEKQAKEIIDKFVKELEKIEKKHSEEFVDRKEFERQEKLVSKDHKESFDNGGFKKKMIENSPRHDDDFVIAEKKEWV